ncbi:hypothetical protein [Nocardioides pakistanensis]
MHFEDLEVGLAWRSDPRSVTPARPVATPAEAAVVADELWRESQAGRVLAPAELRQVTACWTSTGRLEPGQQVTLRSTVVRLEPVADERAGDVTRFDKLLDPAGRVVHSGSCTVRVRSEDPAAHRTHRDVGTRAWGAALAELLSSDDRFVSAVQAWDGTLGLRGGRHEIQLRIYRGRIIEVAPRTAHGATFTFGATDRVWADLLTAPDARFGARLMSGEFEVSGDPYEYLRLTKALELLVDNARTLATESTREVVG